MGFDEVAAAQAIRISLGPGVTRDEVERFAEAWTAGIRAVPAHGRLRKDSGR